MLHIQLYLFTVEGSLQATFQGEDRKKSADDPF